MADLKSRIFVENKTGFHGNGQILAGATPKLTKISFTFLLQSKTPQRLKNEAGGPKNETQTFQNQGPGPPKSSPGPSKTLFLRTFNLRR